MMLSTITAPRQTKPGEPRQYQHRQLEEIRSFRQPKLPKMQRNLCMLPSHFLSSVICDLSLRPRQPHTLGIVEQITPIPLRLHSHQSLQIPTPILPLTILQRRIYVTCIRARRSLGRLGKYLIVKPGSEILRLARQRETYHVGLVKEDLVAVGIGCSVVGDVVGGTTGGVEDDEPQQGALLRLVNPGEEILDGAGRDEGVFGEGEGLGVEGRGQVREIERLVFGVVHEGAEPVVHGQGGVGCFGELGGDSRGLVLGRCAVECAGDDSTEREHDEHGAEAPVEFGVCDKVLPRGVGGCHIGLLAKGEGIAVLDDSFGLGVSPEDKFGDDTKGGTCSSKGLEDVRDGHRRGARAVEHTQKRSVFCVLDAR